MFLHGFHIVLDKLLFGLGTLNLVDKIFLTRLQRLHIFLKLADRLVHCINLVLNRATVLLVLVLHRLNPFIPALLLGQC